VPGSLNPLVCISNPNFGTCALFGLSSFFSNIIFQIQIGSKYTLMRVLNTFSYL